MEKTPDADILREMSAFAARRLMDLEVDALTGAAHGGKVLAAFLEENAFRLGDFQLGWFDWT